MAGSPIDALSASFEKFLAPRARAGPVHGDCVRHEQEQDLNKELLGPMEVTHWFHESRYCVSAPGAAPNTSPAKHLTRRNRHGWKVRCARSPASSEGRMVRTHNVEAANSAACVEGVLSCGLATSGLLQVHGSVAKSRCSS